MALGHRAYLVCLSLISSYGCSTDELQVFGNDALVASPQDLERDAAVPADRLNGQADRAGMEVADTPAGDAAADAPASADAREGAGGDLGPAVDLTPDTPPDDLPLGARCGGRNECRSGFCFDGVCCNERCEDGCSACTAARTGRPEGVCGKSADLEGKACGKSCGTVAGVPSVVEKVCVTGSCVVSLAPRQLESCRDENPCVTSFCDDAAARCVRTKCPQAGTCCCRQSSGARMCLRTDTCRGERTCEP